MSTGVRHVGLALMLGGALVLFVMVGVDWLANMREEARSGDFEPTTYWSPLAAVIIGALMVLASTGRSGSK